MRDHINDVWRNTFHDRPEYQSVIYWDLLIHVWGSETPVRKTDCLSFIRGIKSQHTALSYLNKAIDDGVLVEVKNPEDARSRLIVLSPESRKKLDQFCDEAVAELHRTCGLIEDEATKTLVES